jgi:hypothetical protein
MSAAHLRGPTVHTERRCTKLAYTTRAETASVLKQSHKGQGKPYRCKRCAFWHITTGREWAGVGKR